MGGTSVWYTENIAINGKIFFGQLNMAKQFAIVRYTLHPHSSAEGIG